MLKEILNHLPESCPWQDSILYFDTIDSTNTRAQELAAQGAPHGTVLIANHQTGGRGRMGRTFVSPAGSGIYLSVILRPNCPPTELMHLTCASAVAMCDAVEHAAHFRPGIKWTNDLVWQSKKLGGILTELGIRPDGITDYAIVGIGINCCQEADDFPPEIRTMATSLRAISPKNVDRAQVAAAMIESLYAMAQSLLTGKEPMMNHYRQDCITLGKEVSLTTADGTIRYGKALSLDDDGGLVVRFNNGQVETVAFGEISVRGMYGYA